jgi:hypothetical protein
VKRKTEVAATVSGDAKDALKSPIPEETGKGWP